MAMLGGGVCISALYSARARPSRSADAYPECRHTRMRVLHVLTQRVSCIADVHSYLTCAYLDGLHTRPRLGRVLTFAHASSSTCPPTPSAPRRPTPTSWTLARSLAGRWETR
eukprot:3260094-Rhodomonas_salina.2